MRPPAQVDEVAGSIQADLVAFDLVVDQLDLVVLAALSEFVQGLLAGYHLPYEGPILLGDPAHA